MKMISPNKLPQTLRDYTELLEAATVNELQVDDELKRIVETERAKAVFPHVLLNYHLDLGEIPRFTLKADQAGLTWVKRNKKVNRIAAVPPNYEFFTPVGEYASEQTMSMSDFRSQEQGTEATTASFIKRAARAVFKALDRDLLTFLGVAAENNPWIEADNFAGMIVQGYQKMAEQREVQCVLVSPRCIELLVDFLGNHQSADPKKLAWSLSYHELTGEPQIMLNEAKILGTKRLENTEALIVAKEAGIIPIRQDFTIIPITDNKKLKVGVVAFMDTGMGLWNETSVLRAKW